VTRKRKKDPKKKSGHGGRGNNCERKPGEKKNRRGGKKGPKKKKETKGQAILSEKVALKHGEKRQVGQYKEGQVRKGEGKAKTKV